MHQVVKMAAGLLMLAMAAGSAAAQGVADADTRQPQGGTAQRGTAARSVVLTGLVVDPMRLPIAGASVTARGPAGTGRVTAVSDEQGRFTLHVTPGEQLVVVTSPGFADQTLRVSATPETAPLSITLAIAGFQDSVTVDAAAGYTAPVTSTATKTPTPLRDVPQAVTVVTQELIKSQLMTSMADVMRYVPGITTHQGENNRDQVIIRGNSSSADFFVDGVRDDVQYFRDVYNLDRVEALKGPNAMIFGRGGGGGVVNRVTKDASGQSIRELSLQVGSFADRRVTADIGHALGARAAFRVNAMYEASDSFRRGVDMRRGGVNPTLAVTLSPRTRVTLGYELVHDRRVADRGVPSFGGRPVDVDRGTYYGNAEDSTVHANVNLFNAMIEHRTGRFTIRNRMLAGYYDRGYQNYVPGAVSADGARVSLTAYNNVTQRLNLFDQTDVTTQFAQGRLRHTVLMGAEVGRQATDNLRLSGFFNNTATALLVPVDTPATAVPVTYRPNATDANNHLGTTVAAAYGQDQVDVTRWLHVLGGLRVDRFDLQYHNNRNGDELSRVDTLVSPRAGVVVKPSTALSVYGSYGVSYLPSSGDQFSSLTSITRQVEPERFANYEAGTKWDVRPQLALTAAVYRLDRSNTRATDPNDATRIVQTGRQRTNGYEVGLGGRPHALWRITGGYAFQDAFIASATTVAAAGATVAQVPRHTFTLWNDYQWHPRVNGGVGVQYRSQMFAAVDNAVTLPGFVRVDAALQVALGRQVRLQVNVDNLFDRRYFANADNNTNISPGAPRALKVALTAKL